MGRDTQTIDLTAPMEPVVAYGEFMFDNGRALSVSVHHPDDELRVEVHFSGMSRDEYEIADESRRWCFSYWVPGDASPASGARVRELTLDDTQSLVLALDAEKRLMWLHDATTMGNMLIPVTNFYNELMLLKGMRDPAVGLAHRRLFDVPEENDDAILRRAFARYNMTFRKVDAARLDAREKHDAAPAGFAGRIARAFRGGGTR